MNVEKQSLLGLIWKIRDGQYKVHIIEWSRQTRLAYFDDVYKASYLLVFSLPNEFTHPVEKISLVSIVFVIISSNVKGQSLGSGPRDNSLGKTK